MIFLETTVRDYLMHKREDVDLDDIFEREPNIGEGISTESNVVN